MKYDSTLFHLSMMQELCSHDLLFKNLFLIITAAIYIKLYLSNGLYGAILDQSVIQNITDFEGILIEQGNRNWLFTWSQLTQQVGDTSAVPKLLDWSFFDLTTLSPFCNKIK